MKRIHLRRAKQVTCIIFHINNNHELNIALKKHILLSFQFVVLISYTQIDVLVSNQINIFHIKDNYVIKHVIKHIIECNVIL